MSEREVYVALAGKLDFPLTERFERLLRKAIDPQEGRILLASPAPTEELAAKSGMTTAAIDAKLREFAARGLVILTSKGCFFSRSISQLHDAMLGSLEKYVDSELCELWEDFAVNEWYEKFARMLAASPVAPDRAVPHRDALKHIADLQPFEDIEQIVASGSRWTVVPCPCRRQRQKCSYPSHVCIQMNKAAEYAINRGAGRDLTKSEALAVIAKAAEAGLIHQVRNQRSDCSVICNCCTDCCVMFRPMFAHRPDEVERSFARSRYEATVEHELCNGCQVCVDRCQFEAIEMVRVPGSKRMKAVVDSAKCWGCGACVTGCAPEAATLRLARPLDHIPAAPVAH